MLHLFFLPAVLALIAGGFTPLPGEPRERQAETRPSKSGEKAKPKPELVEPDLPEATEPARKMVWVDHATGRFYRKGHPRYGKGRTGEFMDERDALAAGLKEARRGAERTK